jgi:predicted regulator of Ras-like GTPase activity (Roadblock/LC7/MglB family)
VILAATVKPEVILVVAMAVVLVLIVGVVSAMRQSSRQARPPVKRSLTPIPADISHIDLEGRLRAIVLPPKNSFMSAFATAPQLANFQTRTLDRPAGARLATGPITIQPPRPEEIPALLGPRNALPGPVGAPRVSSPTRQPLGLTGGLPALPFNSSKPPVVIMPPGAPAQAEAVPSLPPGGARQPSVQARQVEMAPPESATTREKSAGDGAQPTTVDAGMPLPQLAGPLATGLGTRGFTVIPDEPDEAGSSFESAPLQESLQTTGSGSLAASAVHEDQIPAVWPLSEDSGSVPTLNDIPDAVPEVDTRHASAEQVAISPPLAGDAPDFAVGQQPVAPEPDLSLLSNEDATPLGAMPFSLEVLQLTTPMSANLDSESLASALGALLPDLEQPRSAPHYAGPARSAAVPPDRAAVALPLTLEDDQVGETQVFSTSDLYPMQIEEVEASLEEPLVVEQYAPPFEPQPVNTAQPLTPPPPPPQSVAPPAVSSPATPPMPVPVSSSRQSSLLPAQEIQARQLLEELASLPDVGFVKLLGPDGTVIVSADKSAADAAIDEHIAVLIGFAIMEVEEIGLGEWTSMALEAPGVALLLSPIGGGASLAILLSNPARLGLLRRQLRKPLSGLQEVLSGARVS